MTTVSRNEGVTVIMCCYNSSARLLPTLTALSKQKLAAARSCEILLIDNASTDDTARVAREIWAELGAIIPFIVIPEPIPGLTKARHTGYLNARYPYIVYCDDDNWLDPDYIDNVFEIFKSDNDIAACGGKAMPVFETPEPAWFGEYCEAYATGSQQITSEQNSIISLYGAGMAVRKEALTELYKAGFKSVLQDRKGKALSSSGDVELSYALRLMGYKLVYNDTLTLYHYLPKERLTKEYLKKLFVAFGNDGPIRNLYYSGLSKRSFIKWIRIWPLHFGLSLARLIKYLLLPPKKHGRSIYFSWSIAYISSLFRLNEVSPLISENLRKLTGRNK